MPFRTLALVLCALCLAGCKKPAQTQASSSKNIVIGLVTDVGGRGDQSFNDSALRGLELWASGQKFAGSGYTAASADEVKQSVPGEITEPVTPLAVQPMVLQSNAPEDYEPNLQLLVDRGAQLVIATGFMMEQSLATVAKHNPNARFLLIDSRLVDAAGKPFSLPNVRSVVFHEEEGSYLAGALAGLVTKTGKVAFVGGMQVPLIKKFEAGFRAGVAKTNPQAAANVLVSYTGSFDNVAVGKQVGQDVVSKGADVVFHAAGNDGQGVISAVKEARDAGKTVWAIGVDSDQFHVAPNAVLTSVVKHVDLAVYRTAKDLVENRFSAGDVTLGLKEGGIALAPVRLDFPGKADALKKVEELRQQIVAGQIQVPVTP